MNTPAKVLTLKTEGNNKVITITHVTIRQSIFFLLLKLILIEGVAAFGLILFHVLFFSTEVIEVANTLIGTISAFNITLFLTLVFLKTILVLFVIIQWINEYYEITTKEIIHKKGLIFRSEERHTLKHLGSIEIDQGVFGRIFNFGTIRLFNWESERNVVLYLIHNPMKYRDILQSILPNVDFTKEVIREHILEPEE